MKLSSLSLAMICLAGASTSCESISPESSPQRSISSSETTKANPWNEDQAAIPKDGDALWKWSRTRVAEAQSLIDRAPGREARKKLELAFRGEAERTILTIRENSDQGVSAQQADSLQRWAILAQQLGATEAAGLAWKRGNYFRYLPDRPVDPAIERMMPEVAGMTPPPEVLEQIGRAAATPVAPQREQPAPRSQASVRDQLKIAEEYQATGDLGAAEQVLTKLLDQTPGGLAPDAGLHLLAQENMARLRLAQRKLAEAQSLLEQVLANWPRLRPEDESGLRRVRVALATVLRARGNTADGENVEEQIVLDLERSPGADPTSLQSARQSLVATRYARSDLDGTRRIEERLLASSESGELSKLLAALSSLAATLRAQGDFERALAFERQALEEMKRSGKSSGRQYSGQKLRVAERALELDNFPEAQAILEDILATPAGMDLDIDRVRARLAQAKAGNGDKDGAINLWQDVLADRERILPSGHPDLEAAQRELAKLRTEQEEFEAARALQESLLAGMQRRKLPADHPDLLAAQMELAATLERLGMLREALALMEQAMDADPTVLSEGLPPALRADALRASLAARACDFETAVSLRHRVLDWCRRTLPADHPAADEASRELAAVLRVQGRQTEARAIEEELGLGVPVSNPAPTDGLRSAVEAAHHADARRSYPPEVEIVEPAPARQRQFQVKADIVALSGIAALEVRQDGVVLSTRPSPAEWTMDADGTKGRLQLNLSIAEERLDSVVSICAEDQRGVRSQVATVVARP